MATEYEEQAQRPCSMTDHWYKADQDGLEFCDVCGKPLPRICHCEDKGQTPIPTSAGFCARCHRLISTHDVCF